MSHTNTREGFLKEILDHAIDFPAEGEVTFKIEELHGLFLHAYDLAVKDCLEVVKEKTAVGEWSDLMDFPHTAGYKIAIEEVTAALTTLTSNNEENK